MAESKKQQTPRADTWTKFKKRDDSKVGGKNAVEEDRQPQQRRYQGSTDDLKSLYISKLDLHELEGHGLSDHYKQQRVQNLVKLFERYGKVEYVHQDLSKNYIIVNYADHSSAEKAFTVMRDFEQRKQVIQNLADKLSEQKLPASLAPNLKFNVQWAEGRPQTKRTKSESVNAKTDTPAKPTQAQALKQQEQKQPNSPSKQPAQVPQGETNTNNKAPNSSKEQNNKPSKEKSVPQRQPSSDDLVNEAEKAKLNDELSYYNQHVNTLKTQLEAEKERCNSRNINTEKLQAELARILQEGQALQTKITMETEWRRLGEQRIQDLSNELSHFQSERDGVLAKLNDIQAGKK